MHHKNISTSELSLNASFDAFNAIMKQKVHCRHIMNIKAKPDESHVLAVALENLKDILNLSSDDLSQIIRVHRNTLGRQLKNKEIAPKSTEGELAILLIRVYRSLFALNGGNIEAIKHWLNTHNRHIQGVPLECMKSILGLSRVVNYLDAIRGKI